MTILDLIFKIPFIRKAIVKKVLGITYIDRQTDAMLQYVLTDSDGKKYYKYIRQEWLPMPRYEQMQIRLLEIESRISRESLSLYAKANKQFAEQKNFIGVAQLAGELEERLNVLYDPEVIMRFLCGLLIREDQINTAHIWNQKLENEKYEKLLADNENGNLSFFFHKTSLSDHVRFSSSSDSDSNSLTREPIIQNQLKEVRLFDQMMVKILASSKAT